MFIRDIVQRLRLHAADQQGGAVLPALMAEVGKNIQSGGDVYKRQGPKGPAGRRLKRHASWVQNVARQFGPLSSVGVGKLRGADLSTRGPGLTHHWCIGCTVKCMAE